MELRNYLSKEDCLKKLAKEPFERVTLSFYRYVKLSHLKELRDALFREWNNLGVLGRIYLAREGVNAQLSVPEHHFKAFKAGLETRKEFKGMYLNKALEHRESFYKLTITIKRQIVADDLPENSYDLSQVGQHLSPEGFNAAMQDANVVVVDMRNFYESRIGHFDGALCPDSNTFKEGLSMALKALKGEEDKKLLLYCTGGIRCEKASAYFRHHGFRDVNQLRGGIVTYAHHVREGLPSFFKGSNYVFDERISERITPDVLSACDQCENACDEYVNCENAACNLLFLQCAACAARFNRCCSEKCKAITKLPIQERKAYYAKQKKSDYGIYVSRIRPQLK